jgi:hypothetical protein
MKKCLSCSQELSILAKFCSSCGFKVEEQSKNVTKKDTFKSSVESRNAISQTVFVIPSRIQSSFRQLMSDNNCNPIAIISDPNHENIQNRVRIFLRQQPRLESIQYLCIIGNWEDIFPYRIENSYTEDVDQYCFSDALYGCIEDYDLHQVDSYIPRIAVSRIPVTQLDIIKRILFETPPQLDLKKSFLFGISAECWQLATKTIVNESLLDASITNVYKNFNETDGIPPCSVLTSPNWEEQNVKNETNGSIQEPFSVMLFNVHGGPDTPEWVGESMNREYFQIFSPNTIENFNSALLITEACYGGAMQYDEPSIVESFFINGGLSFVGSSTIAYGSSTSNLGCADLLALNFLRFVSKEICFGEALNLAKLSLIDPEMVEEYYDPFVQNYDHKTILSFNLFGAPWHHRPSKFITSSQLLNQPQKPSVLDRVRNTRSSSLSPSNTTINKIRENYRSRLPEKLQVQILQREEASKVFRNFKDVHYINEVIEYLGCDIENIKIAQLKFDSKCGYSVFLPVNTYKSLGSKVFFLNAEGNIQKTLESKEI